MKINMESPLFEFMTSTANLILLNVVFILTCLPLVTIGPATAALYQVLMREARGEHGYLVRKYWKHFREMFWQGTFTFLLLSTALFLLSYAFVFWHTIENVPASILEILAIVLFVIVVSTMIYVFPIMARFQAGFLQTIKNACFLMLANLKYTLILILLHITVIGVLYLLPVSRVFMLIIGFSAFTYCCSYIFNKIFKPFEPQEELPPEGSLEPSAS